MKDMKHRIIKFIIGALLMFLIVSSIVMLLWNWLMPDIAGLKKITFLEAAGLLLLSKILFGGFNKEHWKSKMSGTQWESKFVNNSSESPLSKEQKSILKEKFINKWCSHEESDKSEDVQV